MTGQAIIKAILAGERDPQQLAAFRDRRLKASEEEIARSLQGNWQDDLLFVLTQEQDGCEFCQRQMAEVRPAAAPALPPVDGRLQARCQCSTRDAEGTAQEEERK